MVLCHLITTMLSSLNNFAKMSLFIVAAILQPLAEGGFLPLDTTSLAGSEPQSSTPGEILDPGMKYMTIEDGQCSYCRMTANSVCYIICITLYYHCFYTKL